MEKIGGVIILPSFCCNRCWHEWHPRYDTVPKVCPRCKSPYWNKERVRKVKLGGNGK